MLREERQKLIQEKQKYSSMSTHVSLNIENVNQWLQSNGLECESEDPLQTALRVSEPKEDIQKQYAPVSGKTKAV